MIISKDDIEYAHNDKFFTFIKTYDNFLIGNYYEHDFMLKCSNSWNNTIVGLINQFVRYCLLNGIPNYGFKLCEYTSLEVDDQTILYGYMFNLQFGTKLDEFLRQEHQFLPGVIEWIKNERI